MEDIASELFVWGFLVFAGAFMLAIIVLPTVAAFFINRWLIKKQVKHVGMMLLTVVPAWTAYEVYTAIYPTDSFYFSEFNKVTLLDTPESAIIIRKEASFPDFHGDYCSASLMSLSVTDYNNLLDMLSADKNIAKNRTGEISGSGELYNVMGNLTTEHILHSFTRKIKSQDDQYLFIGLLKDKKSIVVSVCST